ncbi:clostripain-related cysteine peptidase [Bdellovibrio svalbardensis]|uniref:Clostripain-related cysteine peptidase n=1 Tax=Bdellovibrio svalbardensis TaxID=2972972 RepID=A0ABT6DIW0_9BACT|nr:clostripain-related cysteine peptidase [Bdellovibrio svalbardensis]MDG0816803.1 clostripain-related cysteine peptidase [Bdellovibrio svalbardensis]
MNHHLSRVLVCLLLLIGTSYSHAAEEMKEWNFLVYINGVNNLDSFGAQNINQMEEVGSSDKMNILVQWGSAKNPNVTRLLVKKDSDKKNVTSPVVQNLGGADMGDWKELVRFVEWSNQNYPAKHYFIVVWDHGSGWHIAKANNTGTHIQDISWDDRTGNYMTTEQLAQAMSESAKIIGHKVDIYASDACLMGMVEVASEMQTAVQYYVGSQDVEPGAGWPYNTFLSKWSSQIDSLSAKQVATLLSKDYAAAYNGGIYGKRPVTMSAYDMSYISAYEQAFKKVGQELSNLNAADIAKANRAASATKYFTNWDYRDSLDFLTQLEKNGVTAGSFADLRAAQNNFVMSNDQTQDQKTWGVSVWLPTSSSDYDTYAQRYEGLKFHQNSGWGSFLKRLIKK